MNLALYQIIVPLCSLFFVMKAISHFFRGDKTIRELIAWIIFWGALTLIALYPGSTSQIASILGIKSNVNAIMFTVGGVLSYLCFKLLVDIENTEQQITKLTRVLALKEFEERKKE